ncbi:hypothetical protein PGTUg99_031883 [Puccinia graminis f. sp. tritici]|uniref:Uncharacterized protein n=1 Tax=Puccinia graminis f. sp. tritici TaxID=56615 RepID=A0A5B0MFY2_PUCGR|nr:hypothetical protein PGTUg99_031883 [Puccinia graminis f. sp. tritici]
MAIQYSPPRAELTCKSSVRRTAQHLAGPLNRAHVDIPANYQAPTKPADYSAPRAWSNPSGPSSTAGKPTQPPAGRPSTRAASVAGVTDVTPLEAQVSALQLDAAIRDDSRWDTYFDDEGCYPSMDPAAVAALEDLDKQLLANEIEKAEQADLADAIAGSSARPLHHTLTDLFHNEGEDERRAQSDATQLANDLPPSSASHQSTHRVTSIPAVQSLHGDAPISHPQLDLSLPARPNFATPTPMHKDRQYGLFRSMAVPKVLACTPCPSFGEFSRVDKTPVVDNGFPNVLDPAYADIPDDSPGRKNSRGETSYLTEEGDRFLDSVMASVNQNKNLTPAQGNPVPPVLTPPADKQPPPAIPKRQSEHPVVIRERQERRPKYQFSTVRLEGIEDNHNGNLRKNRNRVDDSEEDEADDHGHSKKSRVDFDSESDPDADGIPDNGEEFEPTQQKQQVAVILDHGIGHPAPF